MFINRTFYHTPFHLRQHMQVHGIQHPQGFTEHADRLNALLVSVTNEANGTTDPQAHAEYMQLSQVLVDLISEAQNFVRLPYQLVQMREISVLAFSEKVNAVKALVADWEARQAAAEKAAREAALAATSMSRKRSRDEDEEEVEEYETALAAKRNRNSGVAMVQHMDFDAGFCGPFAEFPQMEPSSTSPLVWWNAPFNN